MRSNEEEFDHNLIPEDKLAILKIKVNKAHRKESDWDVIKDILKEYRIVTAETKTGVPGIRVIDHVLCRNGALFVFTNVVDCQDYINDIAKTVGSEGLYFEIGSLWLEEVTDIADREHMDIYIDAKYEKNHKFIRYRWEDKTLAISMF